MFAKKIKIENNIDPAEIEQDLTLNPVLDYLQSITQGVSDNQMIVPRFALSFISDIERANGALNQLNIESFRPVFEILAHLTHDIKEGEEVMLGFGLPIPDTAFFGTSAFYHITESKLSFLECNRYSPLDIEFVNKTLYLLILERFYNIPVIESRLMYEMEDDGVRKYYQLYVDFSYVHVQCKGPLPKIDLKAFRGKEIRSLSDIQPLLDVIDLRQFKFSGISLLRFVDRTREFIAEKLQHMIGNLSTLDGITFFNELNGIFTSIAGSKHVHHSFFPILELNGFPILNTDFSKNSIFFGGLIETEKDKYQSGIFDYLANPFTLSFGLEKELNTVDPILVNLLVQSGVQSYKCIPLKDNDKLTGFLEIYTRGEHRLEKRDMLKMRGFIPYFGQLAKDLVTFLKNRLDNIILYNYTSIQPAVQWRFNQVAANYLGELACKQDNPTLERIVFENVYPIYGAIDVKDSTRLRNDSQYRESLTRLGTLEELVAYLEQQGIVIDTSFTAKLEDVKHRLAHANVDRFLLDILSFFRQDVATFMHQIREQVGEESLILEELIAYETGIGNAAIGSTDAFELSLGEITRMIKAELNAFNAYVQELFPSYFETFRTDGIEYDLYIGQAITPTLLFDTSILQKIRRQQIISMAKIAKLANNMYDVLPLPLQTTQLIFIHPHEINIDFRIDERRFDVEGGYNIRYQIIKKRIDKVLIRNSSERLVQPNSIAIVYTSQIVEDEIRDNLDEVAGLGLISNDYEFLLLEDLQGVSELKAIRVHIK